MTSNELCLKCGIRPTLLASVSLCASCSFDNPQDEEFETITLQNIESLEFQRSGLDSLTSAVTRELDRLPQGRKNSSSNENEAQSEVVQPWVFPPAQAGTEPLLVSVVDPYNMWSFVGGHIKERMLHSKMGGCRRAVFNSSPTLKSSRAAILYIYLIRCETHSDFVSRIQPRVRAFVEEMQRNHFAFFLLGIESTPESKRVFVEHTIDSVSVSDSQVNYRPSMDGIWGTIVQKIGLGIQSGFETKKRLVLASIAESTPHHFLNHVLHMEALGLLFLQMDRVDEALQVYEDFQQRLTDGEKGQSDSSMERMVRATLEEDSGLTTKRLSCTELLFPPISTSRLCSPEDMIRAKINPSRIFEVERLPFRELISSCTISSIQLDMYLFARTVLCQLSLGRVLDAIENGFRFLNRAMRILLKAYSNGNHEVCVIHAWRVCVSLELVSAGHSSFDLLPQERVRLCIVQGEILERAVHSMNVFKIVRDDTIVLPPEIDFLFSSSQAFDGMYTRLLEACAAHFVAGGRFRYASTYVFKRAMLTKDVMLFQDASRWWSGSRKLSIDDQFGVRDDTWLSHHDHWPYLVAETCLQTNICSSLIPPDIESFPRCQKLRIAKQLDPMIQAFVKVTATLNVLNEVYLQAEWILADIALPIDSITVLSTDGNVTWKQQTGEFKAVSTSKATKSGTFLVKDATLHIGSRVLQVWMEPTWLTLAPAPFPFRVELDSQRLISTLPSSLIHVESFKCVQQVSFSLHPPPSSPLVDVRASSNTPGVTCAFCNSSTVEIEFRTPTLTSVNLVLHLSWEGEEKPFEFELPITPVVDVKHQVHFVSSQETAWLDVAFSKISDESISIDSFSLASALSKLISPPLVFPHNLENHSVFHTSFIIPDLNDIVPRFFSVTNLFVFSAHITLSVNDLWKINFFWNVPVLVQRGAIAGPEFIPKLVSARLTDEEGEFLEEENAFEEESMILTFDD